MRVKLEHISKPHLMNSQSWTGCIGSGWRLFLSIKTEKNAKGMVAPRSRVVRCEAKVRPRRN